MNVIETIQTQYPSMSKVQQRISDYILANPESACFQSLKEFSLSVNASQVSVLRFVRCLGFSSYVELKKGLQSFIRRRVSPGEELSKALQSQENTRESMVEQVLQMDLDNIQKTFQALNMEDLDRVADILKHCATVHLAAQGGSLSLLPCLFIRLNSIGIHVQYFDVESSIFPTNLNANIRPTDAVIIVSFPKHNRQIIFLAEQLEKRGIPIVCITDRRVSEVANHATVSLPCVADTPLYYNSYAAAMVVANVLVSLLAIESKEKASEFLREVDELKHQYKAFNISRDNRRNRPKS